jgi:hypothetical protein
LETPDSQPQRLIAQILLRNPEGANRSILVLVVLGVINSFKTRKPLSPALAGRQMAHNENHAGEPGCMPI